MPAYIREFAFPAHVETPLFLFPTDAQLKADPDYLAAKAGNAKAAVELVARLGLPLLEKAGASITDVESTIVVAPHAKEASGDNAIPQVLASMLSFVCGDLDIGIVQSSRVFHTGTNAMQRLISRASFEGKYENEIKEIFGIEPGALTAEEARYLVGFRHVDEIRSRAIAAREERNLRLRSKGIRIDYPA